MSRFSAFLLAALTAACTAQPPGGAPASGAPGDACGAAGYATLIGSNIAAVTLPADLPHRIIRPGDAVTMDYRADRLNIEVDQGGIVQRVRCG